MNREQDRPRGPIGKLEHGLRILTAASVASFVMGAHAVHAQEEQNLSQTPTGEVGDGPPLPPDGLDIPQIDGIAGAVAEGYLENVPLENSPVTEITMVPSPETNILFPTRSNIVINSAINRTGWTADQTRQFNSESNQVKDWLTKLSQVYDQIGDPELQRAMQVYLSAMGNRLNPVPDYALPLNSHEVVLSVLLPSFWSGSVSQFNQFVIRGTPGFPNQIRYDFQFYTPRLENPINDPTVNEHTIFQFYYNVLLFEKYRELVHSLPDSAFEDNAALQNWLRSDEVRTPITLEVNRQVQQVYSRVSPRLRELGLAVSPDYGVELFDDFEDPARGILHVFEPIEGWERYGRYVDGEFEMSNSHPTIGIWSWARQYLRDSTISAEARTIFAGATNSNTGLVCRRTSEYGGYELVVFSRFQSYALGRRDDSSFIPLARGSNRAIRRGDLGNRLELSCIGNVITATVNGVVVAEVTDNKYSEGYSGIFIGNLTTARFDNFRLTGSRARTG